MGFLIPETQMVLPWVFKLGLLMLRVCFVFRLC